MGAGGPYLGVLGGRDSSRSSSSTSSECMMKCVSERCCNCGHLLLERSEEEGVRRGW